MASVPLIIVSDATGETALQMVGAALVQFEKAQADIIRRPQVTTAAKVRAVVKEAAERKALVLHTLVSAELRRLMLRQCRLHAVDAMDLMGPVLERLSVHLGISPKERPGLFNKRAEGKARQIDAVGFAFRHDDGQGAGDLHRAEIVLVGPSRTMKTPAMLYLAYQGWFCGNVPLVLEAPPAAELLQIPKDKVFGLVMSETGLMRLRGVRSKLDRFPPGSYDSPENIRSEIAYTRRVCSQNGWRMVDTTGKSVEEVAREIVSLYGAHGEAKHTSW